MRGIIEYVRSEMLPHWRVYATALGLSLAWQDCRAPESPPPSPEVEMVGEVAKYAIGAYVAYEMLND